MDFNENKQAGTLNVCVGVRSEGINSNHVIRSDDDRGVITNFLMVLSMEMKGEKKHQPRTL